MARLIEDSEITALDAMLASLEKILAGLRAKPIHTDPVVPIGVAPVADFSGTPLSGANAPVTVKFTNKSTGTSPLIYKWDMSDGAGNLPENSQKDPTWKFWATKSYTIKLTVTNAYGSNTMTKTNYITVGSTPPATSGDVIPEHGAPETVDGYKIGGGS